MLNSQNLDWKAKILQIRPWCASRTALKCSPAPRWWPCRLYYQATSFRPQLSSGSKHPPLQVKVSLKHGSRVAPSTSVAALQTLASVLSWMVAHMQHVTCPIAGLGQLQARLSSGPQHPGGGPADSGKGPGFCAREDAGPVG
eukprot:410271-Pelagomonas_calceolata.AAC.5